MQACRVIIIYSVRLQVYSLYLGIVFGEIRVQLLIDTGGFDETETPRWPLVVAFALSATADGSGSNRSSSWVGTLSSLVFCDLLDGVGH